MKTFNDFEKKIIQEISKSPINEITDVKNILEKIFFNKSEGKAIIIQLNEQYAMYFLSVEIFDDVDKRKTAIQEFSQFVTVLNYLDSHGYISIFRNNHYVRERVSFISDEFINPRIENKKLVLNNEGLHSIKPEEIKNKNGVVLYKGIEFNDSFFIIKNMIGKLLISDRIFELIKSFEPQTEEIIKPKTNFFHKFHLLSLIPAFLLLCLTGLFFTHHHKKTQQLLQKYDSIIPHKKSIVTTPTKVAIKKYGIDISRWNGNVLNHSLPDSLSFVICKATEGLTLTDPMFRLNWLRIQKMNLKRGAYHFFIIEDSPVKQAEYFWSRIKDRNINDFPPIVDIESGSTNSIPNASTIQKNLLAFITHLENLSGVRPIIYSSYYYANEYLTNKLFSRYPLWVADYDSKKQPKVPNVWKDKGWLLWQKTSSFKVNSILTDLNVLNQKKN